jgi:Holliday junction resolvase
MPLKSLKAKGSAGERELAALLTAYAHEAGVVVDLTRNLEQTRGGGHDLLGLEDYGMAVEVKRVEQMQMNSWWAQAVRQAERVDKHCIPVLAWRQNRKPWRFRVRTWIFPCSARRLDIDLELSEFKLWFQDQLLKER